MCLKILNWFRCGNHTKSKDNVRSNPPQVKLPNCPQFFYLNLGSFSDSFEADIKADIKKFIDDGKYEIAAYRLLNKLMELDKEITPDNYMQSLHVKSEHHDLLMSIWVLHNLMGKREALIDPNQQTESYLVKLIKINPFLQLALIHNLISNGQYEDAKTLLDPLADNFEPQINFHYHCYMALYLIHTQKPKEAKAHAKAISNNLHNKDIPLQVRQHLVNLIINDSQANEQLSAFNFTKRAKVMGCKIIQNKTFHFEGDLNQAEKVVKKYEQSWPKLSKKSKLNFFYASLTLAYNKLRENPFSELQNIQNLLTKAQNVLDTLKNKDQQAHSELSYLVGKYIQKSQELNIGVGGYSSLYLNKFLDLVPKEYYDNPIILNTFYDLSKIYRKNKEFSSARHVLIQAKNWLNKNSHGDDSEQHIKYIIKEHKIIRDEGKNPAQALSLLNSVKKQVINGNVNENLLYSYFKALQMFTLKAQFLNNSLNVFEQKKLNQICASLAQKLAKKPNTPQVQNKFKAKATSHQIKSEIAAKYHSALSHNEVVV